MPTLHTARLLLRPLVPEDFAAVHGYASDPANMRYMLFGPNTEADTRGFIAGAIQKAGETPRTAYEFAVALRENQRLIGGASVYLDGALRQGSLGWLLNRQYWKRGLGTEIAAELLRFCFEDLRLHRVWASCHADNYGSYRVMERNRMRREARLVQNRPGRPGDDEPWYDEYIYAMLDAEWRATR